jgi:fatty-acyl-CoA synthase/benzoate-CoA ligase/fatty acid CoA ligase FadD22
VPAPGVDADEQVGEDLISLARARLAAYKVPRSVTFVGALPRTPTGKLRRFMLRSGEAWRAPVPAGEP